MIDKKKVIEYMESIYRYFPHIEFIGIDLNGEMIFTVKAKGHCFIFITSDKYINLYNSAYDYGMISSANDVFNDMLEASKSNTFIVKEECDNVFDPNEYVGYIWAQDHQAFGWCQIVGNLSRDDRIYDKVECEFTSDNIIKLMNTTYVYTVHSCGEVNRITLNNALSVYPNCAKCDELIGIQCKIDLERRISRLKLIDVTEDLDKCIFKCIKCGNTYTDYKDTVFAWNRKYGECVYCYAKEYTPKLIGRKYGKLRIVQAVPVICGYNHTISHFNVICQCDCGGYVSTKLASDKLQRTTCENCGRKYQKSTPSTVDKIYKGKRYGKLTIIKAAYIYNPEDVIIDKPSIYQRVICQCDCGNFNIPVLSSVLNGQSKSCGCCDKDRKPKVPYPYDLSFYEMEYKK